MDTMDVCLEDKEEMMRVAVMQSAVWRGFSSSEIRILSDRMDFITVQEGEKLMTKGEAGTFFCVVLSGSAEVAVQKKLVKPLGPGALLGHMSIFQGSTRGCALLNLRRN